MKKTRKIKFTLGMKIASILCCVALISVGFASWWIVNYPVEETAEGNFVVYNVEPKNITINAPTFLTTDDANIIFGAPTEDQKTEWFGENNTTHTNYGWLGYNAYNETNNTTGVKNQDLTATLEFNVSVDKVGDQLSTYLDYIYVDLDAGDTYEGLIGSGVAAPTIKYRTTTTQNSWTDTWTDATGVYNTEPTEGNAPLSIAIGDSAMGAHTVYVQVQFIFGWSYTSSAQESGDTQKVTTNPYLYYNAQEYSPTLAGELSNTDNTGILNKIYTLNGTTDSPIEYEVTIHTDPAGTAAAQ